MPAIVEPIRKSDRLSAERLKPQQRYRACDAATLGFHTTDELPECAITRRCQAASCSSKAMAASMATVPRRQNCHALLSLAEVPLMQSIAVTGSVNQRGEVQPVGGINEKIEGFFDVCSTRGLTGREGVLIPAANTRHLMLRRDVIDAVAEGRFHVYAIDTVDQGIEILTGIPAGTRDDTGAFAEGSINHKVERRLIALASQARAFKIAGESLEAQRPRAGSTGI